MKFSVLNVGGVRTKSWTLRQEEAMGIADRIVVMNGGKIEQQGSPEELYRRPATPFVADFLGRVNRVVLPNLGEVSLRPEAIKLVPSGEGDLSGRVSKRTFMGPTVRYSVVLESGEVLTVEAAGDGPGVGEPVGLSFPPESILTF